MDFMSGAILRDFYVTCQTYTLADVTRWYSMHELHKAKAYLNSITQIAVQPDRITAQVRGTAKLPMRWRFPLPQAMPASQ